MVTEARETRKACSGNPGEVGQCKRALDLAIANARSMRWCLTLWGRFIRARDGHCCVSCNSDNAVQAHHIFRRSLYPQGWLELGNGITLCRECHRLPHSTFNRRPDLSLPIGAEGGDDQDDAVYYYGIMLDDARRRGLDENELYFISDSMLLFFVRVQGYENLFSAVQAGKMSRLEMAYEIWRVMPSSVYSALLGSLFDPALSADSSHLNSKG